MTVGLWISQSQPHGKELLCGSRAFTAGGEFHPAPKTYLFDRTLSVGGVVSAEPFDPGSMMTNVSKLRGGYTIGSQALKPEHAGVVG